ncbi:MAG: adenine phosphoribosyltransferase [Neisseriaceae bacterium]|nr:adenine phosphoribosyltransferase [Neisseriaceae bacterium]MBP6860792.1 adenine phosphoribosyltransferase [Neisseriaceae bacterium]
MSHLNYAEFIEAAIRKVPNWPSPGILFYDITPILQDPKTFRILVDLFVHRYMDQKIDVVAGLDARGFILGAAIAYQLNVGFVPIRKKGKLPFTTVEETYELEYGNATVEMHVDAVKAGDRVLLVDDLIATGGTMQAGFKLLQRLNAEVVEAAAIIEFNDLEGAKRIRAAGLPLFTICQVDGVMPELKA